jgi:hypothetical protein
MTFVAVEVITVDALGCTLISFPVLPEISLGSEVTTFSPPIILLRMPIGTPLSNYTPDDCVTTTAAHWSASDGSQLKQYRHPFLGYGIESE